jgi:hypothetical protein
MREGDDPASNGEASELGVTEATNGGDTIE